jgi:ubiquitin-conjugating enzyme E2 G1
MCAHSWPASSFFHSSPLRAEAKNTATLTSALPSLPTSPLQKKKKIKHSEGGFFNALLTFPPDYPQSPPTCRFTSEMWHPNVYADGRVCISILHSAGDDPMGYESAAERWSPVHTVETIMISIISMLSSPNDESPANIDAAKEWREDRAGFRKRVARIVRKSQEML